MSATALLYELFDKRCVGRARADKTDETNKTNEIKY